MVEIGYTVGQDWIKSNFSQGAFSFKQIERSKPNHLQSESCLVKKFHPDVRSLLIANPCIGASGFSSSLKFCWQCNGNMAEDMHVFTFIHIHFFHPIFLSDR